MSSPLFRTEAIKAGFKQAWNNRDYVTIVRVAQRLPESVVQEDPDLLIRVSRQYAV